MESDTLLDNIQKFQYLKAQLGGDAEKVIEGLALTNANYTEAMKLLQNRYGQPHKVRGALMKALWELPKPSGELVSLRTFFFRVQEYIRGLDSLGNKEDSYRDLLVPTNEYRRSYRKTFGNSLQETTKTGSGHSQTYDSISKEIDAMDAGDVDLFTRDSHTEQSSLPPHTPPKPS